MRPVIYNDVLAAVAVVAATSPEHHQEVITALIRAADSGDVHRTRFGSAHPVFGDGSLMAATHLYPRRGCTSFQSATGRGAWLIVLMALSAHLGQAPTEGLPVHSGT